jgi:hypothetical protein
MNAFQILNKAGEPIPLNTLDEEVCELLDIKPHPKNYCRFGKREDYPEGIKGEFAYLTKTSNWFDTIGWLIAADNKSFQEILDYYADVMKDFIGQEDHNGKLITLESIYPYRTKVLKAWISKGYQPKQIVNY